MTNNDKKEDKDTGAVAGANKIAECPLVPWYKFHICDIGTCKNHTSETARNCLELDRRRPEGTKQFSDAELNLYKFRHRKISTRQVQIYRKNAVQAVKAILVLHKFVEWLAQNYQRGARYSSTKILALEAKTPLSIKRLGWQNWMWEYVFDTSIWEKFSAKSLDGEARQFEIWQLLGIEKDEYAALLKHFQPQTKDL